MDELSEEDKLTVARARKVERFPLAAVLRGRGVHRFAGPARSAGRHDPLVQGLVEGEYDHLPEAAFYMVGSIDMAIEKAQKMAAQA